jgi:hypothetical protein
MSNIETQFETLDAADGPRRVVVNAGPFSKDSLRIERKCP